MILQEQSGLNRSLRLFLTRVEQSSGDCVITSWYVLKRNQTFLFQAKTALKRWIFSCSQPGTSICKHCALSGQAGPKKQIRKPSYP